MEGAKELGGIQGLSSGDHICLLYNNNEVGQKGLIDRQKRYRL